LDASFNIESIAFCASFRLSTILWYGIFLPFP
jgi:hypothetical protein